MKVCVTGGAGFIGSHLADRLVGDGHEVHIIDNLSNGRTEFVPTRCRVLYADLEDQSTLRYVSQMRFDVVYHLAAKPRVSYSIEFPAASNEENVGKTVKLLEACRGNVGRFVFASSSSVYGNASQLPTPESSSHDPRSPYALQKVIGEHYLALFADLYGMDVACVRPFNVIGPRQLAGGPYDTAFSSWLHAIKHDGEIRFDGDGKQTRDLTHVTDVADVFARVGSYGGKLRGEAFNAGAGGNVSNTQLLAWLLSKHPEARERVKNAPARANDVQATCASTKSIELNLGWKRNVELWDGLESTRQWALESELF